MDGIGAVDLLGGLVLEIEGHVGHVLGEGLVVIDVFLARIHVDLQLHRLAVH